MVTVTITIKPYLARYMYVRYAQSLEPESESRPSPSSSASLRKPIPIHLSLGQESALTIEKEIEVEMRAELYEFLLDNKFNKGVMFKKSMALFVEHYEMVELVQEESLIKAFQRWRKLVKEERK